MILVGKKVAGDYYIHRKYMNKLGGDCNFLYNVAREKLSFEQDRVWNLLKINQRNKKVSFLVYPNFDTEAHPKLKQSISINLSVSPPTIRIIKGGGQILHRKELFVGKDYLHYVKFAELTNREEELGLLQKDSFFKGKKLSTTMGRKEVWEEWLNFNNVKITDHEVKKLDDG